MVGKAGRARELTRELTSNPFFPLLFVGKAAETSAFYLVSAVRPEVVGISYLMAVISIIAWLYTYDEVKWGLHKAAEAAEEVTEDN